MNVLAQLQLADLMSCLGYVFGVGGLHKENDIFLLRGLARQEQTITCSLLGCTIKH